MINVFSFVSIIISITNFINFLSFNHDFPKVIILALDSMVIWQVIFQFIYLMFQAIPLYHWH
jgi:hypothetical protein